MNYLEKSNELPVINMWFIELNNLMGWEPVVRYKKYTLGGIFPVFIKVMKIETDSMKNIPQDLIDKYIMQMGDINTYIVFNISDKEEFNKVKTKFTEEDFLFDLCRERITKKFLIEHIFFIIRKIKKQSVNMEYGSELNYICKKSRNEGFSDAKKIMSSYIKFRYPLILVDKKMKRSEKELLRRVLKNDSKAQFDYAMKFKNSDDFLYFLWMKKALENGYTLAKTIDYKILRRIGFGEQTILRLYKELFECGAYAMSRELYEAEEKKEKPDIECIKKYSEGCIRTRNLMGYFHYINVRCYVLSKYKGVDDHIAVMKAFKTFFDIYNSASGYNREKMVIDYMIAPLYYGYATEMNIIEEENPDFDGALIYYKKALDLSDDFDDKVLDMAKEFCIGENVNKNVEHGINLLRILIEKNNGKARTYMCELADVLMKQRDFSLAERCYKICIEFDKDYCRKYIIARMFREMEERDG